MVRKIQHVKYEIRNSHLIEFIILKFWGDVLMR